jgi:FkbM family methyltransferase
MRIKRLIQKKTKKFIIKKLANNYSTIFQAYNLSKLSFCKISHVPIKFHKKNILADKNEEILLKIDGQILPKILETGSFDPFIYNFLKKQKIKKNFLFIDVGANHGLVSKQVSNLKFIKKIITFEPAKDIYELLRINLSKVNKVKNYNYGWATKKGILNFYENQSNSGDFSLLPNKQRNILHKYQFEIANLKLKKIMENYKDYQYILKTDCQGYDFEIFNSLDDKLLENIKFYFLECQNFNNNKKLIFLEKISKFKKIKISCPLIHKDLRTIKPKDILNYFSYKVEFDLVLIN